jgi:phosphoserine phosphatase
VESSTQAPLCVDLDGTLLAGDTLLISVRTALTRKPWVLLALPFALIGGRPAMKRFLASRVLPDPGRLPWRSEVLDFVRQERATGRQIYLVTAADRLIAERVSQHLGLFDRVIATDGRDNLKGQKKLQAIRSLLTKSAFDYVGDSSADLPIFRAARWSYLVAPGNRLRAATRTLTTIRRVFAG